MASAAQDEDDRVLEPNESRELTQELSQYELPRAAPTMEYATLRAPPPKVVWPIASMAIGLATWVSLWLLPGSYTIMSIALPCAVAAEVVALVLAALGFRRRMKGRTGHLILCVLAMVGSVFGVLAVGIVCLTSWLMHIGQIR